MEGISAAWLYPIILVAGALQAWGPPMNSVLRNSLTNPWLASLISFLPVISLLGVLCVCLPRPLPTVGAGAFAGLTITANILMSLVIDHFGLFGVQQHSLGPGRAVGAVLMVAGVFAISKF